MVLDVWRGEERIYVVNEQEKKILLVRRGERKGKKRDTNLLGFHLDGREGVDVPIRRVNAHGCGLLR